MCPFIAFYIHDHELGADVARLKWIVPRLAKRVPEFPHLRPSLPLPQAPRFDVLTECILEVAGITPMLTDIDERRLDTVFTHFEIRGPARSKAQWVRDGLNRYAIKIRASLPKLLSIGLYKATSFSASPREYKRAEYPVDDCPVLRQLNVAPSARPPTKDYEPPEHDAALFKSVAELLAQRLEQAKIASTPAADEDIDDVEEIHPDTEVGKAGVERKTDQEAMSDDDAEAGKAGEDDDDGKDEIGGAGVLTQADTTGPEPTKTTATMTTTSTSTTTCTSTTPSTTTGSLSQSEYPPLPKPVSPARSPATAKSADPASPAHDKAATKPASPARDPTFTKNTSPARGRQKTTAKPTTSPSKRPLGKADAPIAKRR